jgi:hypothetical protein
MPTRTIFLLSSRNAPFQRAHFAIVIPSFTSPNAERGTLIKIVGAPMAGYKLEFERNHIPASRQHYQHYELFPIGEVDVQHIMDSEDGVHGSAFPSLYEVQIVDGHVQTTVDVPEICSPNPIYNASCHTSDVLLAWGTLNSKTKNVDPYYDDRDIYHSQLIHDVFGAFFRARNPNPDLGFLRVRGPAYASTLSFFEGRRNESSLPGAAMGLAIEQYMPSDRNMTVLGMPPGSTANIEDSDQCAVLREYGFTFQRAHLTD